jgi:hypothetical protein
MSIHESLSKPSFPGCRPLGPEDALLLRIEQGPAACRRAALDDRHARAPRLPAAVASLERQAGFLLDWSGLVGCGRPRWARGCRPGVRTRQHSQKQRGRADAIIAWSQRLGLLRPMPAEMNADM